PLFRALLSVLDPLFFSRRPPTTDVYTLSLHDALPILRFWVGPSVDRLEEVPLREGESYRIVPGTVHRMEAVTDVDILEASTPDLDDVVRLEDRYGRV